jgi:hypothetical protein
MAASEALNEGSTLMNYDSEKLKRDLARSLESQKARNDKFFEDTGIKSSGALSIKRPDNRWFMNSLQFGQPDPYMEGDDVEKDWVARETSFESSIDDD